MPNRFRSQAPDHQKVTRLGSILTVAFSVIAIAIVVGFMGTSVFISKVQMQNSHMDLLLEHRTQTQEIITLAQAIDDLPNGKSRKELLAKMADAVARADMTLSRLQEGERQSFALPWENPRTEPALSAQSDYVSLFNLFLQQSRAYMSAHQPGSPLSELLGDHHQQIQSWSIGPLTEIQLAQHKLQKQRTNSALVELWIFNSTILFVIILILGIAGTVVLRKLLSSAQSSVESSRESQERLAIIIDNIEDGIIELATSGAVRFMNRSAARMLGIRENNAGSFSLQSFLGADNSDGHALTLAFNERQNASAMALLLRRPDGSCFRASVTLTILPDSNRSILTFRDITVHVSREERLRKLSHAMEYSPTQVIITDFNGMIEYVNPAFQDVTGWTLKEVQGRSPRMLSSGTQDPTVYRDMWSTLRSGQPWRGEFQNQRKDGSSYWVRASIAPIKDDKQTITHFVAVQEDVTKEVIAQKEVETSRRRLREAVSSLPHGFAIYDAEERLTMSNSAYRTMYTHAPEAIRIGSTFTDIIRAGYRAGQFSKDPSFGSQTEEEFIKNRLDLFRTGGSREMPLSHGRWVLATETITPSHEHVCLRTDITELKTIQGELEEARSMADHANTAKSQFLSAMSHELRTPLNAILGFAQLLQLNKKAPLTERQADQVQQILGAGHHLLTLIDEILDLAKIEAGRVSLSLEPVDSITLVNDCEALIRHTAEGAGLTMITKIDDSSPDLLWVHADYTRLKQVLLNLLSNAVKYNSANGCLWLSVRPYHNQDDGSTGVEFSVADSGEGIPLEKRDDLFKPFSRLGRENSSIEGTGIGLALTHQLVQAMDGVLLVEDRPGGGTQFLVRMPPSALPDAVLRDRAAQQPPQNTTTANAPADDGGPPLDQADGLVWESLCGNILCVGLPSSEAAYLRQILHAAPEVVLNSVRSPDDALIFLSEHPRMTVLLYLPDDDSLSTVAQFMSNPRLAACDTIALSAVDHPSFRARLRRMGFLTVLSPAPSEADLYALLSSLLDRPSEDNAALSL